MNFTNGALFLNIQSMLTHRFIIVTGEEQRKYYGSLHLSGGHNECQPMDDLTFTFHF